MMAYMVSNKNLNPIATWLFIKRRKLNITKSYFAVPKFIRLNYTHCCIMKISNKKELQQIRINHFSDIDFKHFMTLYKKCTAEACSFLINHKTLQVDNHLRCRHNLLERI